MIATYGDASAIGILFLGLNFADYGGVGDIFAAITGDVLVDDVKKSIHTCHELALSNWSFPNTLAQAYSFVGKLLVPNFGVFGVVAQLVVL